MSWLWEKVPAWRWLVRSTRQSPLGMAAFTAAMFVVPYQLGKIVLWTTNPGHETDLERKLQQRTTLEHKVVSCIHGSINVACM